MPLIENDWTDGDENGLWVWAPNWSFGDVPTVTHRAVIDPDATLTARNPGNPGGPVTIGRLDVTLRASLGNPQTIDWSNVTSAAAPVISNPDGITYTITLANQTLTNVSAPSPNKMGLGLSMGL